MRFILAGHVMDEFFICSPEKERGKQVQSRVGIKSNTPPSWLGSDQHPDNSG